MRYRDTRPLNDLINTALGGLPHKKKNIESLVMQAWYQILPTTKDHIQHTFIKNKALYIKTKSPLLRHQLYLEKNKIQKKLQEAIQSLGGNPNLIHEIFFI